MPLSMNGTGAVGGQAAGPAFVVRIDREAMRVDPGAVMIVSVFHPYLAPALRKVAGLIVEEGGLLQHAVILAREFRVPTVVGVRGATTQIATGAHVMLDGRTGEVEILGPAS